MDGLTTNGVLVMHPRGGFTDESQPGVWREISVCGDVYTLRETRSAQQRGKLVSWAPLWKMARRRFVVPAASPLIKLRTFVRGGRCRFLIQK